MYSGNKCQDMRDKCTAAAVAQTCKTKALHSVMCMWGLHAACAGMSASACLQRVCQSVFPAQLLALQPLHVPTNAGLQSRRRRQRAWQLTCTTARQPGSNVGSAVRYLRIARHRCSSTSHMPSKEWRGVHICTQRESATRPVRPCQTRPACNDMTASSGTWATQQQRQQRHGGAQWQ